MLIVPYLSQAQEEKNIQAYWIHEDRVKPSMTDEYEQVAKDLVAACKECNTRKKTLLPMEWEEYMTSLDRHE